MEWLTDHRRSHSPYTHGKHSKSRSPPRIGDENADS